MPQEEGKKKQFYGDDAPTTEGIAEHEDPLGNFAPFDKSSVELVDFIMADLLLMKRDTCMPKDTAIIPRSYIWKGGSCRMFGLHPPFAEPPKFTPESLTMETLEFAKYIEADAVALLYDTRGVKTPSQFFDPSLCQLQNAWRAWLRIKNGDMLWTCAQPYSIDGKKVTWGGRILWDSTINSDTTHRETFQLPAWYRSKRGESR